MLVALTALTATCWFNLIYAKHTLESSSLFVATHDPFAKAASVVNLMVFIYALRSAFARDGERASIAPARMSGTQAGDAQAAPGPAFNGHAAIPWSRTDAIVLGALIVLALSRLWHLGYPSALFDEREFTGQARAWLAGQSYFDSQPPLGVELIALSIRIFGDYLWSWRFPMAAAGIALVAITYLLGRRMLGSRSTAALAAAFILCDGLFLVQSRVASPEIVFVTFAALSYLLLFRFIQSNQAAARRRTIASIGLALGLCIASRLYIPIAVLVLVMGTLILVSIGQEGASLKGRNLTHGRIAFGALLLIGSIALLVYLLAFVPNYLFKPWGGLAALWQYFQDAGYFDHFRGIRQDPRASPWWSWPIMPSPVTYWRQTFDRGQIGAVIAGGNPVLWFGALGAIVITAVRLLSRTSLAGASLAGAFLVAGYVGLWIAWLPIAGNLFLYDFMPSLYLGYLALAAVLSESWRGGSRRWEQAVLMLALGASLVLMLGAVMGTLTFLLLAAVWIAMALRSGYAGKFVSVSFLASALIASAWFLPVWFGLPISADGYQARAVMDQPAPPSWW